MIAISTDDSVLFMGIECKLCCMGRNPCWNTFFPKIAQARNLEVAGNLDMYFQIPQFFVYAGKKQIYNWSSITVLYINIL